MFRRAEGLQEIAIALSSSVLEIGGHEAVAVTAPYIGVMSDIVFSRLRAIHRTTALAILIDIWASLDPREQLPPHRGVHMLKASAEQLRILVAQTIIVQQLSVGEPACHQVRTVLNCAKDVHSDPSVNCRSRLE